jgi:hypothetical protein
MDVDDPIIQFPTSSQDDVGPPHPDEEALMSRDRKRDIVRCISGTCEKVSPIALILDLPFD